MGSITKERAWLDLQQYELTVVIDPENQLIKENNVIHYKALESYNVLQIVVQPPLTINKVFQDSKRLKCSLYSIHL